jgi:mono/diheme cytochrome c family protein
VKQIIIYLLLLILIVGCQNEEKNLITKIEKRGENTMKTQISKGEVLYKYYCTGCHSINMRRHLTASALGNITKHRTEDYLLKITQNYMKEVNNGNEVANCLFDGWRNVMLPYEYLEKEQIRNIYKFIESESKEQGIKDNEIQHITSCYTHKDGKKVFLDQNGEKLKANYYEQATLEKIFKEIEVENFEKYFFKKNQIKSSLPYEKDTRKIDVSEFRVNVKEAENIVIRAFFKEQKYGSLIPLKYSNGGFQFDYDWGTESLIEIPKEVNDLVFLAIEEVNDEELLFGKIIIDLENINQTYNLEIKKLAKEKVRIIINK